MQKQLQIKTISPQNLNDLNLTSFVRHQVTTKMLVKSDEALCEKSEYFVDDWTASQKHTIEAHLKKTVMSDGVVIIGHLNDELIAFACLEPALFNDYIELSFLHVSKPYRHLGIGRALFEVTKQEALNKGAKKLYIGSHPSIESQHYYQAMGCVLAKRINQDIYHREPLDLQLEYDLTT